VSPDPLEPEPASPSEPATPAGASRARRERRERRQSRDRFGLGALLVVVGAILLLRDSFGVRFQNWWVVFLLVPAAVFLYRAYGAYQTSGSFDREVARHATPGLVLVIVSVVFLFGLSWNLMGPVLLIFLGAVLLLRRGTQPSGD
jgi:cation transport ATPase